MCRWAGQALFGTLSWDVVILTLLYSTAGVTFLLSPAKITRFLY